jgi:hypothetical protein
MSELPKVANYLGSYQDFLDTRGIEHSTEAYSEYGLLLDEYRQQLAAERGMSSDELHRINLVE